MFLADKLNKGGSLGGYQISRSLRFNSADSAYLNRTPASAGNRTTWTYSGWVKRSGLANYNMLMSASSTDWFGFTTDDTFWVRLNDGSGLYQSSAVYRDVSAWYHVVVAVDTTQATASNRMKLYINGVQITSFGTNTQIPQNTNTTFNSTVGHGLGYLYGVGYYANFYSTEVVFIDGSQLTPSSFGETNSQTGVWQPKAYSGSYGTNGFYLNFSDNSNTTAATLGKDYSGNGNNWTPNNFSVTAGAGNDSLVDSPTSYGTDTGVGGTVRGNYCTWNPLDKNSSLSTLNGNLDAYAASGSWFSVRATFGMSSGKWYWECTPDSTSGLLIGIGTSQATLATYVGGDAYGWSYFGSNGSKFNSNTGTSYGSAYSTNDVVGIAFDADNGTLTFYKNGTSQGTAYTGLTSGPYFPMVGMAGALTVATNFGQRPFAYTAPSGFKALCTQNLPTPTIGATTATQAGKYFNPVLYTGTGATLSVTGAGFQPDLVWIKQRNASRNHNLYDAVRGALKVLQANVTDAEVNYGSSLTSFDSDGFSLGTASDVNVNAATYVGWNWKANGSGSTNTSGSITSTVSANTTSGFSVVTWTGTGGTAGTVGHGLGVAPSFIIVKNRPVTDSWYCYHSALGNTQYIVLNSNGISTTQANAWGSTNPTSTVFTQGTWLTNSGQGYVAYCFAEISGYSKISSYVGNGSSDGTFVYCGFRPAYVVIKSSTTNGTNWVVKDSKRNVNNVVDKNLFPNFSIAETTEYPIDFLSNGFKVRDTSGDVNTSGSTYIFMALAENPFKYSLAR